MKNFIFILAFSINLSAIGQLADGSIAPDFTLTDYNGNTHNLYSYLNNNKTVYLEIFAAHCPSCWDYHQTHRLKNIYNLYGPDGTDEIMVLALEHDEYNDSNAFIGNGDPWVTQGDWLTGTPYPLFNVEGWPDRGVFLNYNVTFYPVLYKICPDKIVERVSISTTEAQLYQKVQNCQTVSISEEKKIWNVYFNRTSRNVMVEHSEEITSVAISNLNGQLIKTIHSFSNSTIDISEFASGIYLFEFKTESGSIIEKINLN